ncbi:MAG: hypothetical protein RIR62_1200 [Pseudomonadota bacterium]|jgi:uncharacterized protein (TIGR02186 family)
MRWLGPLLALALAAPLPAVAAEEIVSGLSQNRVSITADFDGSELLIYGAVKRASPAPEGRLDVIITVEGPSAPLIIRRKERVAGIWINTEKARVDAAPSFYAVQTTGRLDAILTDTEDLRHRISIPRALRAVGLTAEVPDPENFVASLIRLKLSEDVYRLREGRIEFAEDTLFRTDVVLPANLTEGDYAVRLFLLRDGRVIAEEDRIINVRKEGLERFLFNLSREQPLVYGLVALLLAGLFGWGASAAFRLVRA